MSYLCSEALLERALCCIPLGSQTFSKSLRHFPVGASPFFASHGSGPYLYDVDDNRYIDLVNGLAAVTLGYCDDDVNAAIRSQLERGTIFSLSSEMEISLAERIISLIPCAEMVRFGKNGSDATTAAVRLARAYTGREKVVSCGYHGWHDWYIGSTDLNLGVPLSTQLLTETFAYNDSDGLEQILRCNEGNVAAVILEPMNASYPDNNFLERVRELCDRHGVILVFDETVTGFRLDIAGAQKLFGVTPDLATFGKGIANGMPLSFVCGRKDLMSLMDRVFYSFTFGGELLSIAAALAVLDKLEESDALQKLESNGRNLAMGTQRLIGEFALESVLSVSGHPSWTFLNLHANTSEQRFALKTLYMQETLKHGLICLGSHNVTLSHDEQIIRDILQIYKKVFSVLAEAIDSGDVTSFLSCEPLTPLFSVRQ